MGLINGTGSLTRFVLHDPVPDNYMEDLPKMIARHAFKTLDETSDLERSTGWVNIMDMFDTDFAGMGFLKEPYIAMSWRVDVRKVPANALKQYSREEEQKIKEMENVEYLSGARKKEIREMTRMNLLKRAIPRTRTYDMIWNLETGIVIFGATSHSLCDEFVSFFIQCFGLRIGSIFPYSTASGFLKGQGKNPDLLDALKYSIILEDK
jgi:DNA recombination-dependent growth factor C